nr:orf2 protein [Vole astrovirus]
MARRRRNATINVKSGAAGVTVTATGRRRMRRRRGARSSRATRGTRTVSVNVTAPARRTRITRRTRVARQTRAVVRRALVRAGVTGPRPALVQRATATLGTVGANQGDNVEREGSFLLNPALTKETTGSNQFGPIQVSAASYGLWKMKSCIVKVQPLVGASAVSGTIVRISLNQTATPSQASWSALGARKHVDTTPGKPVTFTITERDLCGPKEGWFMTNTKTDPQMCIGGSIDVHTYGKTMSAYTNTEFGGPLFILEMTATWMFASYNPESAMLNLIKGAVNTGAQGARLVAEPGEALQLVVPPNAALTRAVGPSRRSARALARATPSYPTVGEVIFSVVDATVTVATNFLPWPISWLVAGGWWFIKKVTGLDNMRAAAGEAVFNVYASIADAKNNIPVVAESAIDVALEGKEWSYQQVTPGNFQGDIVEDDTGNGNGGGGWDPDNPPTGWYYIPDGLPTCPVVPGDGDPTVPGIDPNDPPDGWYYYPDGPPPELDPDNPPAGWMYLPNGLPPCPGNPNYPDPQRGQPYVVSATFDQITGYTTTNGSNTGLTMLAASLTTTSRNNMTSPYFCIGPRIPDPNGNTVTIGANAVLKLDKTQAKSFIQYVGGFDVPIDPESLNSFAPVFFNRFATANTGDVFLYLGGNSVELPFEQIPLRLTYALVKTVKAINSFNQMWGANTSAYPEQKMQIFTTIADGALKTTLVCETNTQRGQILIPSLSAGEYLVLAFVAPLTAPYITLYNENVKLGYPGQNFFTAAVAMQSIETTAEFQETIFGRQSGRPVLFHPPTQQLGTWTTPPAPTSEVVSEIALNPASGTHQVFSMDDLMRALNALEAEGKTDSGRNGEELSGGRPPTPYDNIDGCGRCSCPPGYNDFLDPVEGEEETDEDDVTDICVLYGVGGTSHLPL